MKIESYDIRMDSAGARSSSSTRKLQFMLRENSDANDVASEKSFADTYTALANKENDEEKEQVSKTSGDNDVLARFNASNKITNISDVSEPTAVRDLQSLKQQFVLYLWRILFGDESAKDLAQKYGLENLNTGGNSGTENYGFNSIHPMQTIQLYGVQEVYEQETQSVSFSSKGNVTTADGRSIDFNIDVAMTSSFERYYRSEGVAITNMCDPLVLNFSGDVADLSDQKFTFDLDCDGEAEQISMLKGGNGFLALDKNGDGIINDGAELFGTKSGDGFADLAQYDLDGNGWIDENDDIFESLKVWYKDEDGEDKLLNLKESGVGAIYLGSAVTDYNLRSTDTFEVNGAIRKMGLFLYENATIGTMVHLDIAN